MYKCPQSYKFRNVDRIRLQPKEDIDPEVVSKRQRGIELHEKLSQFITGTLSDEEFEFVTPEIVIVAAEFSSHPELCLVETEFFFDLDYNPQDERPKEGIYIRPDFVLLDHENGTGVVYDWKFASPDYDASMFKREVEWYIAALAAKFPDIGFWRGIIHFPEKEYSLPYHDYDGYAAGNLQAYWKKFIDRIRSDHFYFPLPARSRCRFCDYRSEDSGGTGTCEDTYV
jgi:hypothetical protein